MSIRRQCALLGLSRPSVYYKPGTQSPEQKIKRVVAASSASIYGQAEEFPTTEEHHGYRNRAIYGAIKRYGEGLLRSFFEMYGLNYVALRYFNVYGPRMDAYGVYTEVMIRWMERLEKGEPCVILGDGSQTMDFVFVEDAARANLAPENDIQRCQPFGIPPHRYQGLRIVEPLGYHDSLGLTESAAFVLTDSGGLRDESTYFRTPCLTLRPNTERLVTRYYRQQSTHQPGRAVSQCGARTETQDRARTDPAAVGWQKRGAHLLNRLIETS